MKRRIVFKANDKVVKMVEVNVRDESHIATCVKYPSQTFKARKGKGSYTRKSKYGIAY